MSALQVVIVSILGVVVAAGFRRLTQIHKELPPALAARPDLPMDDLYREYFGDLGTPQERFSVWWGEIAEAFEVPAGRIRPTDRFGVELPFRVAFGTSDEDLFLGRMLNRHAGKGTRKDLPKLETVDQFIRYIAANATS